MRPPWRGDWYPRGRADLRIMALLTVLVAAAGYALLGRA